MKHVASSPIFLLTQSYSPPQVLLTYSNTHTLTFGPFLTAFVSLGEPEIMGKREFPSLVVNGLQISCADGMCVVLRNVST